LVRYFECVETFMESWYFYEQEESFVKLKFFIYIFTGSCLKGFIRYYSFE